MAHFVPYVLNLSFTFERIQVCIYFNYFMISIVKNCSHCKSINSNMFHISLCILFWFSTDSNLLLYFLAEFQNKCMICMMRGTLMLSQWFTGSSFKASLIIDCLSRMYLEVQRIVSFYCLSLNNFFFFRNS